MILGVIKRNPLFLHEIEWKNNRFLFTIPNISGTVGHTTFNKKSFCRYLNTLSILSYAFCM